MPANDVLSPTDVAEFRALTIDLSFADQYEVVREVGGGTDEFGNTLPASPAVVEVGMCSLQAGGLQPNERVIADRLGWEVAYAVDLPFETQLSPPDRIRINGRTFEVGGVTKEGFWGMTATAVVREVG